MNIEGGETFGQLLLENVEIPIDKTEGTYHIKANIKASNQQICAQGHDEVVAVSWEATDLAGNGAYYGGEMIKLLLSIKKLPVKNFRFSHHNRLHWIGSLSTVHHWMLR